MLYVPFPVTEITDNRAYTLSHASLTSVQMPLSHIT